MFCSVVRNATADFYCGKDAKLFEAKIVPEKKFGWQCRDGVWTATDGLAFVAQGDDGKWYARLDDANGTRVGPFGTAALAMAAASEPKEAT